MPHVAIIQARMGSSRLPGKTLERLGDRLVLDWVTQRAARSSSLDQVIVATSDRPEDDAIAAHLAGTDTAVVRGSADDVLDRYRAAVEWAALSDDDIVVRITADCPFVDPSLVDLAISTIQDGDADYASSHLDGRFPRGLDIEAVRVPVLMRAAREATDPVEREHVTPFVYRRTEEFGCATIVAPDWAQHPEVRFTLDEPDDLRLLRAVVDGVPGAFENPSEAVVAFLVANPDIAAINADVAHRNIS